MGEPAGMGPWDIARLAPQDRSSGRVRVKICGVTSPSDARALAEAGADWIGINFHPPSPRFVTEERAVAIVEAVPEHVAPVGVFCNRPTDEVLAIAARVGLRVVQLHGDEGPEDVAALGGRFPVVRAFRIGSDADIAGLIGYVKKAGLAGRKPDAVLVDARVDGQFGGTGRVVPVGLLDFLAPLAQVLPPMILAGGLTPENVAERISRARPWMVDVAGGVESEPGRKDLDKARRFIEAARRAWSHGTARHGRE